ncbi:TIGR04282 family arsenosugar biosynthesis glycosyltransferase [Larkinella soli]|uniref:TIGR04282 family arsenosugar biosynthesis glycosyltransferase n=1 Tax=Larkinella soli TaxID=1770527 RepID=UPI000FFBAFB6|nr:TIGR04282 family arsenosugar biosynthesis glycosyltransferase [Larkinella soli]
MTDSLLILFIKNPVRGKVKTRLAATVGEETAFAVYEQLLRYTLKISRPLACDKVVYYSDFIPPDDDWLRAGYRSALQTGDDLGHRMKTAFAGEFGRGYRHIAIIGSDCPQLETGILETAFDTLREKDAVIGPATDGGYYLLGMNRLQPQLFEGKRWSTDTVLADTLRDLQSAGMTYRLLPELTDIDEEKDLITTRFQRPQ